MDYEGLGRIVRAQVDTVTPSDLPIAWPNIHFEVPNPKRSYIRPSVIPGNTSVVSIGAKKDQRNTGVVIIQIFTPEGSGEYESDQLVKLFVGAFDMKRIHNVSFRSSQKRIVGISNGFYQVNVITPYIIDYIV